jgi:hypothetical protein
VFEPGVPGDGPGVVGGVGVVEGVVFPIPGATTTGLIGIPVWSLFDGVIFTDTGIAPTGVGGCCRGVFGPGMDPGAIP